MRVTFCLLSLQVFVHLAHLDGIKDYSGIEWLWVLAFLLCLIQDAVSIFRGDSTPPEV